MLLIRAGGAGEVGCAPARLGDGAGAYQYALVPHLTRERAALPVNFQWEIFMITMEGLFWLIELSSHCLRVHSLPAQSAIVLILAQPSRDVSKLGMFATAPKSRVKFFTH